jgi:hypothetical protein
MPVSRRSETLAERLGFRLVLLGRSGFRRPWSAPLAYPLLVARTIGAIVRLRPNAIVIIAPPFVAPLVVLPFAAALRAPVAIDIHSGALLDRRWRWSVGILAWAGRHARCAVVTLSGLAHDLERRGVTSLVVPDPLPHLVRPETVGQDDTSGRREMPTVMAICGWGDDEPLEELVDSARGRPWQLVITGRPRRAVSVPDNVRLAGFLPEADFVALLYTADVVIVLTTRENTLLSGAWEAIAAERPLVLSKTAALVETFGEGPFYTDPDRSAIADAVAGLLAEAPRLNDEGRALRTRFEEANDGAVRELASALRRRSRPN